MSDGDQDPQGFFFAVVVCLIMLPNYLTGSVNGARLPTMRV